MMNIKGAIFDMDGTLIDSLMVWDVLWNELGELFCDGKVFVPTEDDNKAIRTMTLEQAMNYLHSVYGIGKSGEELLGIANKRMENFYANEVQLKEGVLVAIKTADKIGMNTVGIFDKYNYGQSEIEKISSVYISEGETLEKLIVDINIVSFNIRAHNDGVINSIEKRAHRLASVIEPYEPDIIGFQESAPTWEPYLEEYFGDTYDMFNKYRCETTDMESCPILWRKDKFECIDTD